MGNLQQMQHQEQLTFYTQTKDPCFGTCDIYTSNKFSSCYIAKVISPVVHISQFELYSKIEDQQNIFLVSLYGYKFGKNCNCDKNNIVTSSVTSFWEYLPISLSSIIQQHKSFVLPFHESEIWYIIKACIHGYKAFQRIHISFDFQPSKLMVNQDGRIRLRWMHVKEKNTHSLFYSKIKEGSSELEEEDYFSPEQLWGICHKQQFTHKPNIQKTNVFSLGMLLLHCLALLDPKIFYLKMKLNYQKINQVMNSNQCSSYSPILLKLIGSMLNENPKERPSFTYISENYESLMKRDDHIRMVQSQNKEEKKMSISQRKLHVFH